MSREEFISNYLKADRAVLMEGYRLPEVRLILSLIGSIYDLQQQINEMEKKTNENT